MTYIMRDIEPYIISLSKEYACILLMGPRQVGKTTMLRHCMDGEREYVTLDDLEERRLA
jgi:predicted AAA+ superfamily ATPase